MLAEDAPGIKNKGQEKGILHSTEYTPPSTTVQDFDQGLDCSMEMQDESISGHGSTKSKLNQSCLASCLGEKIFQVPILQDHDALLFFIHICT